MTATDTSAYGKADGAARGGWSARVPGMLARWWRRRRADRRRIEFAVWDLRERYGDAAYSIARASARAPAGFERRKFWRKVADRLQAG